MTDKCHTVDIGINEPVIVRLDGEEVFRYMIKPNPYGGRLVLFKRGCSPDLAYDGSHYAAATIDQRMDDIRSLSNGPSKTAR